MDQRPLTYRAEIVGPVLQSIAAGECCSIIGLSGVGKSNMVQHMMRPDVIHHYVEHEATKLRFVTYDANMLAERSPWGFFEGLAEALYIATRDELSVDEEEYLRRKHGEILAAADQYTFALRSCAEILELLCKQWRIVVLFDEFDALFTHLASSAIQNLRGLRDRHKYQLMYITFSRQPLVGLRDDDDWDDIEAFVELVSLRELGLHPLQNTDAQFEVARFAARHNQMLPSEDVAKIVAFSGGHPALLRALTQARLDSNTILQQWNKGHFLTPAIQQECTKIWQQLTGDEVDGLFQVVHGKPLDAQAAHSLAIKGLVKNAPGKEDGLQVFSPVLDAYLRHTLEPTSKKAAQPIVIDLERNVAYYYGVDISGELSELEHRLFVYLWQHLGEICPIEEVAKTVYPDTPAELWIDDTELIRVHTLVGRLRRHLQRLVPNQPGLLSTIRKRGVRLGLAPA